MAEFFSLRCNFTHSGIFPAQKHLRNTCDYELLSNISTPNSTEYWTAIDQVGETTETGSYAQAKAIIVAETLPQGVAAEGARQTPLELSEPGQAIHLIRERVTRGCSRVARFRVPSTQLLMAIDSLMPISP